MPFIESDWHLLISLPPIMRYISSSYTCRVRVLSHISSSGAEQWHLVVCFEISKFKTVWNLVFLLSRTFYLGNNTAPQLSVLGLLCDICLYRANQRLFVNFWKSKCNRNTTKAYVFWGFLIVQDFILEWANLESELEEVAVRNKEVAFCFGKLEIQIFLGMNCEL